MKKKSVATLLLSILAAASLTTGVAVTAVANGGIGGANAKKPAQNTQNTALTGNEAYFVGKEDSVAEYGKDNNSEATGIKATLVADDKLTIKNVINLNEMYAAEKPFLEIKPIVETSGVSEYKRMVIEVVDVYDETNFIKIQINAAPQLEDSWHTSYFLACASNGQKLTGYESSGSGSGKLHVNDEYGQYATFSFNDLLFTYDAQGKIVSTNNDGRYTGTGFFYDVEKNSISATDPSGRKREIIDFDEPAYFGTNLWSGFTTGEVYCRIKCDEYKKEKASFLVSKYGNFDLSNPEIFDEVAPVIKVDYGAYAKDALPNALLNRAYPLFPVSTFDAVDGELETDIQVYLNYYSSSPVSVSVKNGAFTPQMPTSHYVVYSATDAHGNKSEEVVQINVVNSVEDLKIEFENLVTTTAEGDAYTLPAYTVNGALGNPNVEVIVTVDGESIAVENNCVRPYAEGEMQVAYKVTDYVGRTHETSFNVTVEAAVKPTFIETPILPKYLIAGNDYILPKLNAYNYVTARGDAISTEIYVKENGVEKSLQNGEYSPANVTETQIIYRAEINGAVNEYSVTIPVYNVKNDDGLDMGKYFLGSENSTVTTAFDGIILEATADATFEYINYVTAISLDTEFSLGTEMKNAEKVHIYFTDIANPARTLKFTYVLSGSQAYFYVNDDEAGAVPVDGAIEEEKRFALSFIVDEKKVDYDIVNSNILPVGKFLNGEEFTGFTNHRAYVTYAFEGVEGSANICVNALNGHYFSDEADDWISPLIDLVGNVGGEYSLGDVATLPQIVANDVLAGDVKAYITVTSPSGKPVTTVDGKLLDNFYCDGSELKVKLDEYGCYAINVTAEDNAYNPASIPTVLWVVDTQAPAFTLSGKVAETAKVGAKVTLPTVKASDDLSKKLTVKIHVIIPGGAMLDVSNSKGFVAKTAGTYTVVYYVEDEAGNFALEYYKIKVS
ncbi:MAG: hypothetical protein IJ308_01255 [Clostridia bacterium]|nr:hypothetical protein [Clostridia bacterium]